MRSKLSLLFLLAVTCASPQNQPVELIEITQDTVVGTLNGRKLTAGEFEKMTQNLPPNLQYMAGLEPQKFLEQQALAFSLQAEAERAGLAKLSPYREQIERATREILANGMMAEKAKQITFSAEELRKVYDGKRDDFRQALVKVIFVSKQSFQGDVNGKMKTTKTPAEAQATAADVAKQAREGKDFVALAKKYSDDTSTSEKEADLPYPIRSGASNVPQAIRTALFEAKPGDIVGPLEHNTGYYIFRVESRSIMPFDSAKDEIEKDLRSAAVEKWMAEMRKKSTVSLDHKAFWNTYIEANKAALQAQQRNAGGAK